MADFTIMLTINKRGNAAVMVSNSALGVCFSFFPAFKTKKNKSKKEQKNVVSCCFLSVCLFNVSF